MSRDIDHSILPMRRSYDDCKNNLETILLQWQKPEQAIETLQMLEYHARHTYCAHVFAKMHEWETEGPITRMAAVNSALAEAVQQPEENGVETQDLLEAMYDTYTNITYYKYIGFHIFGAVEDLFHAAANEMKVEDRYHNNSPCQVLENF